MVNVESWRKKRTKNCDLLDILNATEISRKAPVTLLEAKSKRLINVETSIYKPFASLWITEERRLMPWAGAIYLLLITKISEGEETTDIYKRTEAG